MIINFLKYDQNEYDLEERNLYGIYENDTLLWYIEIFPKGEENYLMLNALSLNNLINPFNLQSLKKEFEDDLYEHTVQINGEDGFIQSLKLEFGEWEDNHYSKILIHGAGIIEHDLEEIEYDFGGIFQFKGISIFETNEEDINKLIEKHFTKDKSRIKISYEEVQSGLACNLSWN